LGGADWSAAEGGQAMTLEDLLAELKTVREQIESVDPNSLQADDLFILEKKIERRIAISGFDSLSEISSVSVPDLTHLRELGVELSKAIADEKKRVDLVGKILSVAKNVATVAGLPIP
jgi:hypothetical protein